jgi:hypothetical protein
MEQLSYNLLFRFRAEQEVLMDRLVWGRRPPHDPTGDYDTRRV